MGVEWRREERELGVAGRVWVREEGGVVVEGTGTQEVERKLGVAGRV